MLTYFIVVLTALGGAMDGFYSVMNHRSPLAMPLFNLLYFWGAYVWVRQDSVSRRVWLPFDYGFLLSQRWEILLPLYFWQTRRMLGVFQLTGLAVLYFGISALSYFITSKFCGPL